MGRQDLIGILLDLEAGTLTCDVTGGLRLDGETGTFHPDDVEEAAAELAKDLERLIAWAKAAPKRQQFAHRQHRRSV